LPCLTLETDLVTLQRSDRLAKELLGVLVTSLDTRNVDLLPFYWNVVCLEDLANRLRHFSTNTITCGESSECDLDWVLASDKRFCAPGIRVTVYFPPYLLGLKMSD